MELAVNQHYGAVGWSTFHKTVPFPLTKLLASVPKKRERWYSWWGPDGHVCTQTEFQASGLGLAQSWSIWRFSEWTSGYRFSSALSHFSSLSSTAFQINNQIFTLKICYLLSSSHYKKLKVTYQEIFTDKQGIGIVEGIQAGSRKSQAQLIFWLVQA